MPGDAILCNKPPVLDFLAAGLVSSLAEIQMKVERASLLPSSVKLQNICCSKRLQWDGGQSNANRTEPAHLK